MVLKREAAALTHDVHMTYRHSIYCVRKAMCMAVLEIACTGIAHDTATTQRRTYDVHTAPFRPCRGVASCLSEKKSVTCMLSFIDIDGYNFFGHQYFQ